MARSILDIYNLMLEEKSNYPELNGLTSSSKVSVWSRLYYSIAVIIWSLEKLFDIHILEVNKQLEKNNPHTLKWYHEKIKRYRYGQALIAETDEYDDAGLTQDQITNMEVIKYAAVVESQVRPAMLVKVSADSGGNPGPLTTDQLNGLKDYLHQIKDAGVLVNVVNYLPDLLQLNLRIYYDPSVIDSAGNHLINGNKPVEIAIDTYLKNLPYNGELILQELQDAIQLAEGIKVVNIDAATVSWIDPGLGGYAPFSLVDIRRIAVSGYYSLDQLNTIYYPNV